MCLKNGRKMLSNLKDLTWLTLTNQLSVFEWSGRHNLRKPGQNHFWQQDANLFLGKQSGFTFALVSEQLVNFRNCHSTKLTPYSPAIEVRRSMTLLDRSYGCELTVRLNLRIPVLTALTNHCPVKWSSPSVTNECITVLRWLSHVTASCHHDVTSLTTDQWLLPGVCRPRSLESGEICPLCERLLQLVTLTPDSRPRSQLSGPKCPGQGLGLGQGRRAS